MEKKKEISNWLTTKYSLIIRSEVNLEEKTSLNFTYLKLIRMLFVFFTVVFFLSLVLVKTILKQWLDPEFENRQQARELIELRASVDSLMLSVEQKDIFLKNIEDILQGRDGQEVKEETERQNTKAVEKDISDGSDLDSIFRAEFENMSLDELGGKYNEGPLADISFFKPADGILSSAFDPLSDHWGVDIVAGKDEPIKAIANGTVLMSTWTQETGNVLVIQHPNNLISVYKHNSELLVSEGRMVRSGEIIAIMGNSGELSTGPHLHFEIWFNGHAVNPSDFIAF
ncbi:M23 family metallopeptidase [Persicobacter sp. CCB-QB2]|uniref:M23 family metallopeptidase n=1 Tax=Persicobacter sp. CCB-QB2 TaxID=1561025 RepID=UPI0006A9F7CB|nr:M23 family metallopeptidase [Persicobacter sp. CCB-QB2]